MKQLQRILTILSDGNFHSGEEIGQALEMSRSAVWKILQHCEELGIELHVVRGRGYRIPKGLELLNESAIEQHLQKDTLAQLSQLIVLDAVDSTNRYLLNLEPPQHGCVCLAEQQYAGRGRRGREWQSPYATNVYLSLMWLVNGGPARLSGLSLVVGMAVVYALRRYGIDDLSLKWPNDILYRGAKLAGILVEIAGDLAGCCRVIIGVGLNTAMPSMLAKSIQQPWTDIATILNCVPERNRLAALIIDELFAILPQFQKWGLNAYLPEWKKLDITYGKNISAHTPQGIIHGKGVGIDKQGNLLLQTAEQTQTLLSGEVSVRAENAFAH